MTPEDPTAERAHQARLDLLTIRRAWPLVLDPIRGSGGALRGVPRSQTEDEAEQSLPPDARMDTPRILAFWVHAALDEWPTLLDRPEYVDGTVRMVTQSLDCTDVRAMCDVLVRDVDRLAAWEDNGREFGKGFAADVAALARACSRVAWPPPADRLVIGDCPDCGRMVRVKAPDWQRLPNPTTDDAAYPSWEWRPVRLAPVTCRCGLSQSLMDWRDEIAGPEKPLTGVEMAAEIQRWFGVPCSPVTLRVWRHREFIRSVDTDEKGQALYDRVQVLATYAAREKRAV